MPCWPSRMIGGSITQEIAASPAIVWEVATDRDNATSILSNLLEHETVVMGNEFGVASVVREVRVVNGIKQTAFKQITSITPFPPTYSITANVYLTEKSTLSGTQDAARTGGWTIIEGSTPNSSVFVWTYSAIPEGIFGSLATLLCGKCLERATKRHFAQDLCEYAREAERRQAKKDSKA